MSTFKYVMNCRCMATSVFAQSQELATLTLALDFNFNFNLYQEWPSNRRGVGQQEFQDTRDGGNLFLKSKLILYPNTEL